MWKAIVIRLATLAAMVVCGLGTLMVAVFVLMSLGLSHHGNYEYYGRYPALYLGPAVAGFLAPAVVAVIWRAFRSRSTR